jgi:hypothetical protein
MDGAMVGDKSHNLQAHYLLGNAPCKMANVWKWYSFFVVYYPHASIYLHCITYISYLHLSMIFTNV